MVIILAIIILFGVVFVALATMTTLTELAKIRAQRESGQQLAAMKEQLKDELRAELTTSDAGRMLTLLHNGKEVPDDRT